MTPAESRLREAVENGYPHHTLTIKDGRELAAEFDRLRAAVQHEADCVEAYRAQVETLVRERDEARAERDHARQQSREWLKENGPGGWIDNLRAERDAMAKDAGRYAVLTGWLARHGLLQRIPKATRPDGTHGPTWVLYPPKMINGTRLEGWSATTAACAIDSAIEQEQPK